MVRVVRALVALCALVAVVVGIPAGLWVAGGSPFPDAVPDLGSVRDALTSPDDGTLLMAVFKYAGWVAWASFVVTLPVELAAALRGASTPRLPGLGWQQRGAAVLVAPIITVLLVGSAAGVATATTTAPAPDAPAPTTSASAEHTEQTSDTAASPDRVDAPQHTVVPGDTLWDLADHYLGDPMRYPELVALNEFIPQPDGSQLRDPDLIHPGWILRLPADAVGAATQQEVSEVRHSAADSAVAGAAAAGGHLGDLEAADAAAAGHVNQDAVTLAEDEQRDGALGGALVLGALLAGLLAERRRRRQGLLADAGADAETRIRAGADLERVARLDRALRQLTRTCRTEGIALPPVHAATIGDDMIELHLAPGVLEAPLPWVSDDGGRRWRLDRAAAEADPTVPSNAPFPGLVCIGRDGDHADVLVDLEILGGPVAVDGPADVRREVVAALAAQMAAVPWADDVVIHGVQLPPLLADLVGDRLQVVDSLDDFLDDLEYGEAQQEEPDVLAGRIERQDGEPVRYVLVGDDVPADGLARLSEVSRRRTRAFGLVSAVPVPDSRWQLEVDARGWLRMPLLGLAVQAARLTEQTAADLRQLLTQARCAAPAATGDGITVPPPPRGGDDTRWAAAPARVGVLGALEIRAQAQVDTELRELLAEVATYLALQDEPVPSQVLASAVWPRGVSEAVRDATIARTGDWLGVGADGQPLLQQTADGRIHLVGEVAVDWHVLCTLARQAQAASTQANEADLLRRALSLVRGEVLHPHPADRYSWLPRTSLEATAAQTIESIAQRLVELSGGDPGTAAEAARAGLLAVPQSQELWCTLLRAEHDLYGAAGASVVVEEMDGVFADRGIALDAATVEVLRDVLPNLAAQRSTPVA